MYMFFLCSFLRNFKIQNFQINRKIIIEQLCPEKVYVMLCYVMHCTKTKRIPEAKDKHIKALELITII